MSYGWNAWAFRVDESLKGKNQQIDAVAAELNKKDEQIEKLEVQNMDLQERVWALEDATQSMQAKVEWLFELNKKDERRKIQSEDDAFDSLRGSDSAQSSVYDLGADSSTLNPAIVALHGGYVKPKPHAVRMPMPFMLPTSSDRPLMYPRPAAPGHLESMKDCVARGWHTDTSTIGC